MPVALAAYCERVHETRYAAYIDGLREHLKRIGGNLSEDQRVITFTVAWLTAPIVRPGESSSALEPTRFQLLAYP